MAMEPRMYMVGNNYKKLPRRDWSMELGLRPVSLSFLCLLFFSEVNYQKPNDKVICFLCKTDQKTRRGGTCL
jgi:hypothetical protein